MQYKFCPKCGGEFEEFFEHGYSRLRCKNCGFIFYDKSYPAVSALIVEGDKILLSRRGIEPFKGKWDVVGGFLEKGEHPETGLHREVKEETGVEVDVIKFFGFYMDTYREQSTLNIFYLVKIVNGEPKPNDDVAELKWFHKNELPKDIAFKNNQEALDDWLKSNERI
ncbi:MAG: hypothetical protein A3I07_02385 [Candidatus Doudnabacteria bacterium RIFCSPLOWO2_02_FULL_42_9]|uniref:Nudix hydrolase domain-containing protein n=1 Tax=Candidatus Doudnabacteria bacterium RIFCSPHIGHO2_01_FULL_41_86 TaxID=1817821 RepID=A0A1F5N7L8_9BACT|nr:MAG: hypothetical protein A2717_03095 [Candidatus Doudnabacteria bacterium RIFCSPHIGHO2_01_FULL_41_86]OGE74681.1 MAG: hypothetical protein A3K07_02690 [Candidatus Doudnabacteria bacterium RIFCSPHIGHO2_01_43_10]OGE85040.1 MAG: hypothetical protein A3E28_04500 [Candidatus Doudnabacteria bacterium RIFCSPHIGHO2_12_FULL_42_22]OGE86481.1 MAG: hypothetical protein A3C49_04680 [Candidatus Doudnabacteria bacterium RIFCSPHIGHO2_02_FULL_42_25]OGE91943.1 MAG: hypothetical protein A2895_01445 [Candidatus